MTKKSENGGDDSHVISYLALRKAVGVIGIVLPIALFVGRLFVDWVCVMHFGCVEPSDKVFILSSISAYYWSSVGGVLVGSLCAIGVFLLSYRGKIREDDIAGDLACVFAVGVALFPTTADGSERTVIGILHYLFAAGLFGTLAYFCLVLFQKDDIGPTDDLKPVRNNVYYACGLIIVGCIVAIGVIALLAKIGYPLPDYLTPVFWLEAIAIWFFGWSWFVKGKGLGILRREPN